MKGRGRHTRHSVYQNLYPWSNLTCCRHLIISYQSSVGLVGHASTPSTLPPRHHLHSLALLLLHCTLHTVTPTPVLRNSCSYTTATSTPLYTIASTTTIITCTPIHHHLFTLLHASPVAITKIKAAESS